MRHNFYGQNIDVPLSLANNTDRWGDSVLGRLYRESSKSVYLTELNSIAQTAAYAWRVVDAQYLQEDGIISYFRAYDLMGEPIPWASFGVTWGSCPDQIAGGFRFRPEAGNKYYVPVAGVFPTPNTGGYSVTVLDKDWPSESLGFGLLKKKDHRALVISFRLFELRPGYPNDLTGLPIR